MTAIINALRVLCHLFVDDASLAIGIIVIVLVTASISWLAPTRPIVAGVVLLSGCLGLLLGNIMSAARSRG
jgi:hypothetical protein